MYRYALFCFQHQLCIIQSIYIYLHTNSVTAYHWYSWVSVSSMDTVLKWTHYTDPSTGSIGPFGPSEEIDQVVERKTLKFVTFKLIFIYLWSQFSSEGLSCLGCYSIQLHMCQYCIKVYLLYNWLLLERESCMGCICFSVLWHEYDKLVSDQQGGRFNLCMEKRKREKEKTPQGVAMWKATGHRKFSHAA